MAETLEQVLSDLREEAQVLRKHHDTRVADVMDAITDRIKTAAEDYITWLEEDDAMLRSAHQRRWFRNQYPTWAAEGNAKKEGGKYYYRQIIVPQRANLSAAREDAREMARRMSA
ncbi:MAG TPA: hypothetical protein VFK04_13130 [Gemmatimonadaceae bacterium]|nr:hypothetical protein [Gemmatimonadaceae bacterium]